MCLSNKDYEKYLNIIGILKRQIEKHELPLSPKDIIFTFSMEQLLTKITISIDYHARENLTTLQEKCITDSEFIPLNNLRDEISKNLIFSKRIAIAGKTFPYSISGEFFDVNGNKAAIELNSTEMTLIFAIKSEITIYEYILKEFATKYKEAIKDSKTKIKIVIITMIRYENEYECRAKAKIAYDKLKTDIFKDDFYTNQNLLLFFEAQSDSNYDKIIFSPFNKGISLYLYKKEKCDITNKLYEVTPNGISSLLSKITLVYDTAFNTIVNKNIKLIRKLKQNLKSLPYLGELNVTLTFNQIINDEWNDFVVKELTSLSLRGQLRTKEYQILNKAFTELKIGSSFDVKELTTISFTPQRICSNCNKEIGENDYQYHCYWCKISFCTQCIEDKIKNNTTGKLKYLHTKHNLLYFKTKDENDLKDIDEYKLGKNLFAESSERSFLTSHSAICNGCRGSFPSSSLMCQRYICLSCLPGMYRSGGFVDFDYKCISALRDNSGNYNTVIRNNPNHDDKHHVYLMLICQVGSYKNY